MFINSRAGDWCKQCASWTIKALPHSPELGRRLQLIKSKTSWRKEHSYQILHTLQASGCLIRTGCTLMCAATSCELISVQAASYLWLFSTECHPEQSKFRLFSMRTCSFHLKKKKKSFQDRQVNCKLDEIQCWTRTFWDIIQHFCDTKLSSWPVTVTGVQMVLL